MFSNIPEFFGKELMPTVAVINWFWSRFWGWKLEQTLSVLE